ncbi:protein mono-ADP-ribosyltransferase PARP12-like [Latimeria chalumnae]|uniref:protein mono-ADP-ribosyltransferase PARP12-like n=1 Tax=Latimeria chalumnae TaxID=7897 RepID=UPI00313B4806
MVENDQSSLSAEEDEHSVCSDSNDSSWYSAEESGESTSDETTLAPKKTSQKPCRYYNEGYCKNGKKCTFQHVCKYYLKGNCKWGSSCALKHSGRSDPDSSTSDGEGDRKKSKKSTNRRPHGKHYQWQIKHKREWQNIEHDYIIEAHYSLPGAKRIKLFNSKYGSVSINFDKMKVCGKQLKVRRMTFEDSRQKNEWIWYYLSDHQWTEYGKKVKKKKKKKKKNLSLGSNGKRSIKSAAVEKEYQKNQQGSLKFKTDKATYTICFKEMRQTNQETGTKRKVRRRPKFVAQKPKQRENIANALEDLRISPKQPVWQFEGNRGNWHDFKHRVWKYKYLLS